MSDFGYAMLAVVLSLSVVVGLATAFYPFKIDRALNI